jgi:predicted AAA+ superfamily ATPase
MVTATDLERLLARAEHLIDRLLTLVPASPGEPDWESTTAFRWRGGRAGGYLDAVAHPHQIRLAELYGIERQKSELVRNTLQFVNKLPANNALLWGSRGTGKSSLVKALLHEFAPRGLRLVEVDPQDLTDWVDVVESLHQRPERFILFCDDLSFEVGDPSYKAIKAVLDGSVSAPPENALLYATSNRRHLLPEFMSENLAARLVDGEIHHAEAVEEKISLSERFGLWLSFHPFSQEDYLQIALQWLARFEVGPQDEAGVREAALRWALSHASRSGRSAYLFARDWAGRHGLPAARQSAS